MIYLTLYEVRKYNPKAKIKHIIKISHCHCGPPNSNVKQRDWAVAVQLMMAKITKNTAHAFSKPFILPKVFFNELIILIVCFVAYSSTDFRHTPI